MVTVTSKVAAAASAVTAVAIALDFYDGSRAAKVEKEKMSAAVSLAGIFFVTHQYKLDAPVSEFPRA